LTHDFGAAANLQYAHVNDKGTMTCDQMGVLVGVSVTRFDVVILYGVLTPFTDYYWRSATGKYILFDRGVGAGVRTQVTRDGVVLWERNLVLDLADVSAIADAAISPSGQYLMFTINSTATANRRYMMLYVGS